MKELEILKALEDESIAGMGDGNNHIKKMVIELLCENHNFDLDGFKQCYDYYITNPLKNYQWSRNGDLRLDFKNRKDICELGFYRLISQINANSRP